MRGLWRRRVGDKVALFQPPGIPFLFDGLRLRDFASCDMERRFCAKMLCVQPASSKCRKKFSKMVALLDFFATCPATNSACSVENPHSIPAVGDMRLPALILLVWASGAHAGWKWDLVICDNRRYVPIENVAAFYQMNLPVTNEGQRFRLSAEGRSIEGINGGRDAYINGVKYALCFPILLRKGRTLISAMDVVKIIEPILRPQKIKNPGSVNTVILDAGHGGIDGGATGSLGKEKDAALDVVLRAKKLLQENGYQVRCTRQRRLHPARKACRIRQPSPQCHLCQRPF